MKSYGQLWDRIVSEENFLEGWQCFRRNHPSDPFVVKYAADVRRNLEIVRRKVADGSWKPSNYHQFKVYEPKPRIISCVPVRDRMVHHALCNVIAPLMEARFVDHSYACRTGKGAHAACKRARELSKRHPYFLKMDVHHYFESVDHEILLGLMRRMFREDRVNGLIRKIVEKPIPNLISRRERAGLPIGNLTSQWFANFYLDGLDHFVVEELGVGSNFLRYMDDMLVFCRTKAEAWSIRAEVALWLAEHRRLELKEAATIVAPVGEGIPFLGLRIWPNAWRLKHARLKRTRRSARKWDRLVGRKREDFLAGAICADELESVELKRQGVIRAMDGNANWFGFKGLYAGGSMAAEEGPLDLGVSGVDATSGGLRSARGGNYNNGSDNCRSSYRGGNNAANNDASSGSNVNIGFRLSSTCAQNRGGDYCTQRTRDKSHPENPVLRHVAETNMQRPASGQVGVLAASNVSTRGCFARVELRPRRSAALSTNCQPTKNFT